MIVLGKTSDDKRTQLETLTRELLRKINVVNIELNVLGAGSDEIDVTGELSVPMMVGVQTFKIACECKAYSRPINLPDWLKFLGKIFNLEAHEKAHVHGCFVALSGVNGAVQGSFNQLKTNRNTITLLSGDQLLESTRSIFPFRPLDEITISVGKLTPRTIRATDIAYYDKAVYWVIGFSHDAYTILDNNGASLTADDCLKLREMIEKDTSWSGGSYVSLEEEDQAKRRAHHVRQLILSSLMREGQEQRKALDRTSMGFSAEEIDNGVESLSKDGMVVHDPDTDLIRIATTDGEANDINLALIFRLLHTGTVMLEAMSGDWYTSKFDLKLVEEICQIQGGMYLTQDQSAKLLILLLMSPNALLAALTPIPMIMGHRPCDLRDPTLDAIDADLLFSAVYTCVAYDFERRELAGHFRAIRNVVELEIRTVIKVKGAEGIIVEDTVSDRSRIVRVENANPEIRWSFLHLRVLPSCPEPWEVNRLAPTE